jgi:diadenosine tetraphosphate (Ap4A) HIT family hydrolase
MPSQTDWSLHPQLAADTAAVGDLFLSRVLVIDDANYPWLLLVPRRPDVSEILDLTADEQLLLMSEIGRAGAALKAMTRCDKLNIAALGNVVPQLHVHVIARFRRDPAWPRPVWNAVPARPYASSELQAFVDRLRHELGLAA